MMQEMRNLPGGYDSWVQQTTENAWEGERGSKRTLEEGFLTIHYEHTKIQK